MKFKITLFFLLINSIVFAQDYITFLDPNFKTAVLANGVDTNGDGEIQYTEAHDFTGTLDVSNSNISDAIEVAYFRNITTLLINDNSLSRLYVNTCDNLETLTADNNQLTDVNLSSLTNLEVINLYDNNLTEIDISTNTALVDLSIQRNELEKINVSNNIYLELLIVYENNLQVLDCRFLANLHILNCHHNQISSLDLTYCNSLVHINASNNVLVNLNVKNGNNDGINSFLCDNNDYLTCISVDDPSTFSPVTEAIPPDASYETSCFEQIFIADAWFEYQLIDQGIDIDNGGVIDHKIRKNRAEDYADESLDFSGGLITNIRGIEGFTNTHTFNFSDQNNLTEVDLSYAPWITSLDFSGNNINNINLEGMSNLEELDLENNELTTINLTDCTSLLNLNLNNNNFTSIDISNNTLLETLKIDYNSLTDIDITSNVELELLYMRGNNLTNLNPYNNSDLILLDIRENNINTLALANHPDLTTLYTKSNGMQTLYLNGAPGLMFLFCNENDLTTLNLSNNPLLNTLWAFENEFEEIDLSDNTQLHQVKLLSNNNLQYINLRNRNNTSINLFDATACENLTTVCVDDPTWATSATGWNVSDHSVYNACTIEIPDANFEQALIDLGIDTFHDDDTSPSPNGFIDVDDPVGVAYLDINTRNINNLTGINHFIDLEALIAYGNNLTGIDVSALSHLRTLNLKGNHLDSYYMTLPNPTDLRNLYVDNNQEFYGGNSLDDVIANQTLLEKLTLADNNAHTLELTNFPNLIEVNCSNNPDIDELDVSNSPLLKILLAVDCNITSLDLTGISSLDEIQIQGNGTTSLIFGNQPHLNSIRCFDNELTDIDVSAIPTLGFLSCGNNQLNSLDISSNHQLGYLAVGNNPNLTFLNLNNGNNTTTLSEVYATNLGTGCCIQVDDVASIPAAWVLDTTDTTITNDCSPDDTYVPDDQFETYLETHKYNGTVVAVGNPSSMGNGVIDDNIVPTSKIETVTSLDVSGENIADLTGIQDFTALEILNVSDNNLTSIDIFSNTSLTELNCSFNHLLVLDVSVNNLLTSLDCKLNDITSLDLSFNSNLTYLDAYKNELEELDMRNGNNINVTFFDTTVNPLLACIKVDDADAANAGTAPYDSWSIDTTSHFVETEAECDAVILSTPNEILENGINVYPNPVNNFLIIDVSGEIELSTITLFDSMGKRINTNILNNTISFENLSSGIYLVKLEDSNGNSITRKVVKK
jgi:Leucine-rich repeat (LRR) protein